MGGERSANHEIFTIAVFGQLNSISVLHLNDYCSTANVRRPWQSGLEKQPGLGRAVLIFGQPFMGSIPKNKSGPKKIEIIFLRRAQCTVRRTRGCAHCVASAAHGIVRRTWQALDSPCKLMQWTYQSGPSGPFKSL
jgi:hypothetical protein